MSSAVRARARASENRAFMSPYAQTKAANREKTDGGAMLPTRRLGEPEG
jgi:hypothetical protein